MNLYEDSERGHQARLLMENKLFQECVTQMRASIIDKWRSCPIRDTEGAHELKLMDKVLSDFEGYFKVIADTGKMADIQLDKESKLTKLKKVFK